MRLSREELGALFEHLVKRQRPAIHPDPAALNAAYEEAEGLTSGHPEDEPAALFLALARRSRAIGPIAKAAVPAAAHAAAFSIGLDLVRDDAELALDRLRIVRQAIEWEELRGMFAQRLRPIGAAEITPPRRPR